MKLSPTQLHYLISFGTGALLAAITIVVDQLALHPDGDLDWRRLVFALLGGVVLFARDWIRTNTGAFLEPPAPAAPPK